MNTRSALGTLVIGLALLVAYLIGCATARVGPPQVASAQAPAGVARWEYFCTEGYNAGTIMERANEAGQAGWEMAGAVGSQRVAGLWCFKRPLP